MKTKFFAVAVFGIASLGLSGCVVNVGEGDSGWHSEKWESVQEENRAHLAKLDLGMSKDQIELLMGNADFSEAYIQGDKEVHVLFYRTQRVKGDGKTTKDECTPVVISNNKLVGWGETAYSKI